MKKEPYFIGAEEIAAMVGCGKSKAYQFIQQMNKELEKKGNLTFPGRVPRRYAMERFGLIEEVQDEAGKSNSAAGGDSGGTVSGNRKHRRSVRFPNEVAG